MRPSDAGRAGPARKVKARISRAPIRKVATVAAGRPIGARQTAAVKAGVRRTRPAVKKAANDAVMQRVAVARQNRRRAESAKRLDRERKAILPRYDRRPFEDSDRLGGQFPYASRDTQNRARFPRYREQAERLWPQVRRHYGLPKGTPMPPLKLPEPGSDEPGAAWVPKAGGKVVYVAPETARTGTERSKRSRDPAIAMLLHEWAHVRQKPRPYNAKTRGTVEGGAEAFEQIVAPKVGLRSETNDEYAAFARKVRRRKGRRYVLDLQFKGDR